MRPTPRPRPRPTARRLSGLAAALAIGIVACSEVGVGPERSASVSLSIVAATDEAGGAAAGPQGVALADGHHHLSLERVTLVAEGMRLRSVGVTACPLGAVGCEVLEDRLLLLEAPLDGSVRSLVAALVRPGQYDALGLRLRPPRSSEAGDSAFLSLHEGFEGISVRVEGQWDGAPFTFRHALDDERWLDLAPISARSGRTVNVTLRLDPSSWFVSEDGRLVDPRSVGVDSVAAAAVESRIRTSIAVFEDDDVDGIADSG